ncbi:MAG: hypothetical protein AAF494_12525 [Pseudomonadota bacterium]
MKRSVIAISLAATGLGGCASSSDLTEARSVFYNPYAALEIERGPVGPQCDPRVLLEPDCLIDGLLLARNGRLALDTDGNVVFLTREQRRRARERETALQARADLFESLENRTPLPPGSPALPDNPPPPPPEPSEPSEPPTPDS